MKNTVYCFQDKSEYETDGAYGSEYEYAEGIKYFFFTSNNCTHFQKTNNLKIPLISSNLCHAQPRCYQIL